MTHFSSKRWMILLLMLVPALVSLACVTFINLFESPSGEVQSQTPESGHITAKGNVTFGPGSFTFPLPAAGLADLSSYKATLRMSFKGSEGGQTSQWSKTYVMTTVEEPATRQLGVEITGPNPYPDPAYILEAGGVAYEIIEQGKCSASLIEAGNSLAELWEPAGFLSGVFGAEEAGGETVNGITTNHYIFDQRAIGQQDLTESAGELWVASEGGFLVKYALTTTGNAEYFGEGIEGTATWNYEITDVNAPITISPPENCPAGLVDAPLLPDASNVQNMPGILSYNTSTSLMEATAFYQDQIQKLDWTTQDEPVISDASALLTYAQGDQTMTILISAAEAITEVNILVSRTQEGVIP